MQPLIGITTGQVINKDYPWTPPVCGQSHTYVDAIVRAGGVPILIPLVSKPAVLKRLYELCDGLLFSGGNDLDPTLYGAEHSPMTHGVVPKRDKQELQLLGWALQDGKTVLGICRGMQLINVGLGGSLHQDVQANVASASNHEEGGHREDFKHLTHHLQISPSSRLMAILGERGVNTNSLHHQAVKDLGKDLIATAHAEDGIIEAIELPDKRFVIGIQSHPEALEGETEPQWRKLFQAFIKSAAPN
jgi:putative glutamine amidotransferase